MTAEQVRAERAPTTVVPLPMLKSVRDGWYAWRGDDTEDWTFVRISRPKRGDRAGCIKVQTQHGPNYRQRMVVWPSDKVTLHAENRFIERVLMGIIVNQVRSGIDYGRIKGRCLRCKTELTDPRSRWYSIGPDCEKVVPHYIAAVEEEIGPWDGTDRKPPLTR